MPNGIIIIDKPQDWTSMDVCAKLRGVFGEKRIGHAGTLDPMATGVLPVFVGRATRAVEFAEKSEKEYIAGIKLGVITNTQDIWGEATETRPVPPDAAQRLQALLPQFTGELDQVPPMYSAIKIGGKKLYELARKGVEVERKARKITIYELELQDRGTVLLSLQDSKNRPPVLPDFSLRVRCSKGTYIRTLCHDMGQAISCGGCMSSLRRTETCGFSLSDAHPLEEVVNHPDPASLLLPVDKLFQDRPALTVNAHGTDRLRHGGGLNYPKLSPGEYRVYAPDGEFLLLGAVQDSRLTTIKSFFEV